MSEISLGNNDNGFKVFCELQRGYAVSHIYSEIWHRVTKRWVFFVYVELTSLLIVTCLVRKRFVVFYQKNSKSKYLTYSRVQWVLLLGLYHYFKNTTENCFWTWMMIIVLLRSMTVPITIAHYNYWSVRCLRSFFMV